VLFKSIRMVSRLSVSSLQASRKEKGILRSTMDLLSSTKKIDKMVLGKSKSCYLEDNVDNKLIQNRGYYHIYAPQR
jgi:hypothetical protein